MKALLYAALAVTCLQTTAIAHADPFTQNFYLISNSGGSGGYGNFTLNIAPPATGQVVYDYDPGYFITALNVFPTVGLPFTLGQSAPNIIMYNNGALTYLQTNFGAGGGTATYRFFSSSLTYQDQACRISNNRPPGVCTNDAGIISLTPAAPIATPEPSGLILLGTGLAATCGILRRRFSSSSHASSTQS